LRQLHTAPNVRRRWHPERLRTDTNTNTNASTYANANSNAGAHQLALAQPNCTAIG
jgi:hypothetical protein